MSCRTHLAAALLAGLIGVCDAEDRPPSAQTGAPAGAAPSAEPLGRLFFTPAQRAALDSRRVEALANANRPPAPPPTTAPKASPPQVVTLNGVVRRSDGATTVWVNGKPVADRFHDADITSGSIGRESVGLNLATGGRRVRLKVGQSVEATSGVVEEGYRRRRTLRGTAVPSEDATAPTAGEGAANPAAPVPAPRRSRAKDAQDGDS